MSGSFGQGDRKWQQDELELMLELVGDFWEEEGVWGCRNKWRGPSWAHETGGAPRGSGRAVHPRGQVLAPLMCS